MIRLPPPNLSTFLPRPVSKLSLFLSLPVCRWPTLLTEDGGGRGDELNHVTARKPGPYKSFNTLAGKR
jgi:hypothetical protein